MIKRLVRLLACFAPAVLLAFHTVEPFLERVDELQVIFQSA